MAKILPPKGYITATDVKNRLNISDAMIRYYVQKGKIKYLVPPGRKHGFYFEKDVDILLTELNAFLHIEENEKEGRINISITKEDIDKLTKEQEEVFRTVQREKPTPLIEQDKRTVAERLDAIEKELNELKSLLSQVLERLPRITHQ